ncbi:sulfurtransferase complex subunit TusC [Thalassotalea sp. LPB0316]|uniref:sulfurtransferase complex subunit TusC n=1 Tax=Thalassotalea sp. LPB0316 TaxID=2769490 RepID=UPI001D040935|nr:sulfurtransferase complex subunit TusC [Thalassotalea sp. LPB0316]
MEKSIAIINSHAPLNSTHAKESLDLALILGSYEQATSLFFIGDGVWQLIPQAISQTGAKDFLKTLNALEFYDIEHIYVCKNSLLQRQLSEHFALDNVQVLSPDVLANKVAEFTTILKF